MEYLFNSHAWREMVPDLRERTVLLFLDYDGTLAPIVADPHRARLLVSERKILKDLSQTEGVKMAIVSGRSLQDLKRLVRIRGLMYVGNHGFELEGPKIRHVHPAALDAKHLLHKIVTRLQGVYESFPGILVEDKKLSVSVHYRLVPPAKVDRAKQMLFREIGQNLGRSEVVLREGKKVWEIRPAIEWNKGSTILWLSGRVLANGVAKRVLPIYIGDDLTDEDAFKAIKHRGLAVKVTGDRREDSEAGYYLNSTDEVFQFLRRLKHIKKGRNNHVRTPLPQGL